MHEQITEQRREVPEHLRCRHIFIDGHRCGSYALRNESYCYYHHEKRKPAPDPQARYARRNPIELPKPASRAAIQEAIGKIITYLAFNDIDRRRAGLLLYGLQIATLNLDHHNQEKQQKTHEQPAAAEEQPSTNNQQPSINNEQPTQDDTFHKDVFSVPPSLRRIRRETMAVLLEALAKHHGVEPSPGTHEDRNLTTTETVLPNLQAGCLTHDRALSRRVRAIRAKREPVQPHTCSRTPIPYHSCISIPQPSGGICCSPEPTKCFRWYDMPHQHILASHSEESSC